MPGLTDLGDALAIIGKTAAPLTGEESCTLAQALGRTLSRDVVAPYALPPFTNTAVDGYAFRHSDGGRLILGGASYAGAPHDKGALKTGEAIRIATGAVLPEGADTVAMQEDCTVQDGVVTIDPLPAPGASVRQRGADIAAGSVALPQGRILRPQDVALLNALGLTTVNVRREIRIAIASTGQELQASGGALKQGQIIDTNALMLSQMLSGPGCAVTILPALPDDLAATKAALAAAAEQYDLLVTTGGVSVGDKDFVRAALGEAGRIDLWRLAIRPGKPVLLGRIGSCLIAGLPGNPVSAFVTCLLIVKPIIAALHGRDTALPPFYEIRTAEIIRKNVDLRCFLRARMMEDGACYAVRAYDDQSSNLFTSLTQSDGLIDLSREDGDIAAGSLVRFRPFQGWLF